MNRDARLDRLDRGVTAADGVFVDRDWRAVLNERFDRMAERLGPPVDEQESRDGLIAALDEQITSAARHVFDVARAVSAHQRPVTDIARAHARLETYRLMRRHLSPPV